MARPARHGPKDFSRPISYSDYRTLLWQIRLGTLGAGLAGLILGAILGALSKGCTP